MFKKSTKNIRKNEKMYCITITDMLFLKQQMKALTLKAYKIMKS